MTRFLIVTVCVVFCATAFAAESQPVNLLKNPGLEEVNGQGKLNGWGMRKLAASTDEAGGFHSGERGVKMAQDTFEYSAISQNVSVKPNTDYTAVAWMKGENIVPEAAKGCAMARLYIGKPSPGGTLKASSPFKGTFDWRKVVVHFNSGEFDRIGLVVYLHKSTGTLWADDVALYEGNVADPE